MPVTATPSDLQPPLRWWNHAWRLLLCLVLSGLAALSTYSPSGSDEAWTAPPTSKVLLDIALGAITFALVCLRRRWPVAIAVLTTLLSCFSSLATGPVLLATVSLATRRRWREIIPVALVGLVTGMVFRWWLPSPDELSWWATAITVGIVTAAVMAWGLYIGSRRELLWTLHDRAQRAEAANELRAEKARGDERARIAREMHDVLAHRISQVSMHAGALSFREDLGVIQMRESAAQIQQLANAALGDLRSVLGVLRDPTTGELLKRPQPTHVQIPALVAEAREAGMNIELGLHLDDGDSLSGASGRTGYRLVQEALTNAAKHAPGSAVRVQVDGDPGSGLTVRVSNPLGFGTDPAAPGSGLGLVGLSERMERVGGVLQHGVQGREFVLRGWIPWGS